MLLLEDENDTSRKAITETNVLQDDLDSKRAFPLFLEKFEKAATDKNLSNWENVIQDFLLNLRNEFNIVICCTKTLIQQ